jgi:hypothetical protein
MTHTVLDVSHIGIAGSNSALGIVVGLQNMVFCVVKGQIPAFKGTDQLYEMLLVLELVLDRKRPADLICNS